MNGNTEGSSLAAKANDAVIVMWDAKGESCDEHLEEEMFASLGGFHGVIDYAMRILGGEEKVYCVSESDDNVDVVYFRPTEIEIVFFEGDEICGSIRLGGWTE